MEAGTSEEVRISSPLLSVTRIFPFRILVSDTRPVSSTTPGNAADAEVSLTTATRFPAERALSAAALAVSRSPTAVTSTSISRLTSSDRNALQFEDVPSRPREAGRGES